MALKAININQILIILSPVKGMIISDCRYDKCHYDCDNETVIAILIIAYDGNDYTL